MDQPEIPVFDVRVTEADREAVAAVLRSGWLSMGPETEEFEREFAEHLGSKHVVALSSCTAGLHLACIVAGVGPDDEVIVPSMTFVATANAVRYCGATPVFCDVVGDDGDLNLDVGVVESLITERTKAVIPVHWAGYPVEIMRLVELCEARGVTVIEDAAHAPWADYEGRPLGTYGQTGCFSFFPNKVLGVGEGGAICTDSDELAERLRRLRSQGMTATTRDRHLGRAMGYDVVELGFNYRFDDMRAALLRSRFARLGGEIERRRELIARYRELLSGDERIRTAYAAQPVARSSCYLMGVLVDPEIRSAVRTRLREEHGVQTTVYPATHSLGGYVRALGQVSLPRTEEGAASLFSIPLFPHMEDAQQERVAAAVREAVGTVSEGGRMSDWRVTLTELQLPESDIEAVMATLESGWLTMGPRTQDLEGAFAAHVGAGHAIAVSSGTAALHLACLAAGVGAGDEVIAPALSFIADAHVGRCAGGTTVLADCVSAAEPLLDPADVERRITDRTKAVIAVHMFGYPADTESLRSLCAERGIALIEDCAEDDGGRLRDGSAAGTAGICGCFSFFAKTQLGVGEGGILVTDDEAFAERVRSLRSHAMTSVTWDRHRGHAETYDVTGLGFNYRIDEPRATLALARLGRLDDALAELRRVASTYRERLAGLGGVEVPFPGEWVELSGHFAFPVLVANLATRDRVREAMHANGVQTTFYPALTQLTEYRGAAGEAGAPVAEEIADRHLALPMSPSLDEGKIAIVVEEVRAAVATTA